jgi:hypothetical protein
MSNVISETIFRIGDWLKQLQVRQFLSIVAIGLIVLTTNVAPDRASKGTIDKLDRMVHQEDANRPKTTKEWQQQAREVKGKPGERLERIGEQMYPEVAKRSANELKSNTNN